ncbi:MAG: hypothetical protein DRN15_10835 [Thermoprotei archaeon]|nr:MAG: hypothetical protein DRN15_10835 [Thermoprotei archaeon]
MSEEMREREKRLEELYGLEFKMLMLAIKSLLRKDLEVIEHKLLQLRAWLKLIYENDRSPRRRYIIEQFIKDVDACLKILEKYYH